MGVISIKDGSNKNIECTDLEAHVMMAQQRYKILEERIARAELEVDKINEQSKTNKRIIIGAIVSIVTGACLSLFSFLLKV